ncbi:hypothetical protein [Salipiger sp.]|uniref:hypothetical protein n=1 Tax=Salipiger sp. TaxID=2078585 RepID=UPI003A983AE7
MPEQTYFVTCAPESEGVHVIHSDACQVFPEQAVEPLGAFDGCDDALAEASKRYDRLNACALCCPSCYIRSDAPGAA